jgi:hypothetical protein
MRSLVYDVKSACKFSPETHWGGEKIRRVPTDFYRHPLVYGKICRFYAPRSETPIMKGRNRRFLIPPGATLSIHSHPPRTKCMVSSAAGGSILHLMSLHLCRPVTFPSRELIGGPTLEPKTPP